MTVTFLSHAPRVVPLTLVAGLVAFMAVQAGCSDDTDLGGNDDAGASSSSGGKVDAQTNRVGCRVDEKEQTLAGGRFCCPTEPAALGSSVRCVEVDAARTGDPCTDEAPITGAKILTLETDSCVSETCDGDLETTSFYAEAELVENELQCVGKTWALGRGSRSAKVTRVCQQDQVVSCGGGYGYGYYGGKTATQRAVAVIESTCREGDGASVDCPVGNL